MKEAKDECGKKWGEDMQAAFLLPSFGEGWVVILKQRGA